MAAARELAGRPLHVTLTERGIKRIKNFTQVLDLFWHSAVFQVVMANPGGYQGVFHLQQSMTTPPFTKPPTPVCNANRLFDGGLAI